MHQYGFDMPDMDGGEHFPPVIRRDLQPREAPYCELSYAIPRVGDEGILGAVWQEAHTGRWRCCRYLVMGNAMPPTDAMGDIPVWLVLLLADFVTAVAVAQRRDPQHKGGRS